MHKVRNVESLVDDAKRANDKELLELIRHVNSLLDTERKLLGSQVEEQLVRLQAKGEAIVVGDLHGDLDSLMYILKNSHFLEKARRRKYEYLIFLGDYGDRGNSSPEVYYVILKLKETFPDKVLLLKGNHEGPSDLMPSPHDLPTQLSEKYGSKATAAIYLELRNLFGKLSNAVIIDKQYILIHGGFPSRAKSIRDIALATEKHPKQSHLEEMLWNDPAEEVKGTKESPRGAGKLFGKKVTEKMLKLLGVKILIRGHEPAENGYKINHGGKVLTVFSTNKPPYYNSAAYLQVNLAAKIVCAEQMIPYIVTINNIN